MREPGASAERRAVLIAGPTASGKSALASRLAAKRGGIVVNADSMQLYAELSILTARPSAADMRHVPHALYGFVPAAERFSVARWREAVSAVLDAAWQAGQLPIVVGGTGLYFKALTEGIAAVPPIDPAVRAAVLERAERLGIPALHDELARLDPGAAARLAPADRARVTRALEVVVATGRPLAAWQRERGEPPLLDGVGTHCLVIEPDRELLHRRIEQRLDAMVEAGALAEVEALLAQGLDPALPAMKAIGVREFGDHLKGLTSLDAAIAKARTETRRYAKRQSTWFRHQMAHWQRIDPADADAG